MRPLTTEKKDEALNAATLIAERVLEHRFRPPDSGPGGLRRANCIYCGRHAYANHNGATFGSALNEKCDD